LTSKFVIVDVNEIGIDNSDVFCNLYENKGNNSKLNIHSRGWTKIPLKTFAKPLKQVLACGKVNI